MQILNLIWACLCLAAAVAWLWRCRAGVSRAGVRLVGLALLAGLLFPVISADDDAALWQLQVAQAMPANTHRHVHAVRQSPMAQANFWLLFNHLNHGTAPAAQAPQRRREPRAQLALTGGIAGTLHLRSRAPPAIG